MLMRRKTKEEHQLKEAATGGAGWGADRSDAEGGILDDNLLAVRHGTRV